MATLARITDRSRRLDQERRRIEQQLQLAVQAELTLLWRRLRSSFRRLEEQKPKTRRVTKSQLHKASFNGGTGLWDSFQARLQARLLEQLNAGALSLNQIHNAHFKQHAGAGFTPVEFTTAELTAMHQAQTGELIVDRLHEKNSNLTTRCIHITQELRAQVGVAVNDWYNTPESTLQDLVDELHPTFSEVRAQRIAITETTFLNSRVTESRMEKLGITEWTWNTHRDEIVCRGCREQHGKTFKRGDPMPPLHPNCLTGDAIIESPEILGTFKRWYNGRVLDITTASGKRITVTPNHPILTPEGWIAAGGLQEGSNVIQAISGQAVLSLIDPDHQNRPARIQDIAKAIRSTPGVARFTVPISPVDFHSDGESSQVEIVRTASLLRDDFNPALRQESQDFPFQGGDSQATLLTGESPAAFPLEGIDLATPGTVSSLGIFRFLFGGAPSSQDPIGGGNVPNWEPKMNKVAGHRHPAAGQPASQLSDGDPRSVIESSLVPDRIVKIESRKFVGHVYNLETKTGWFIANGIIAHNCRCTPIEHVPAGPGLAQPKPKPPDPDKLKAILPAGFNSGTYASLKGKAMKKPLTEAEIERLKAYALLQHGKIQDWINEADKGLVIPPSKKSKEAVLAPPPGAAPLEAISDEEVLPVQPEKFTVKDQAQADALLTSHPDWHDLSAEEIDALADWYMKKGDQGTVDLLILKQNENDAGYQKVKPLLNLIGQTSIQDDHYPLTAAQYQEVADFASATGDPMMSAEAAYAKEKLEAFEQARYTATRRLAKDKLNYLPSPDLEFCEKYAIEHLGNPPTWLLEARERTEAAIALGILDGEGFPLPPPAWMNSGHYASMKGKATKGLLSQEDLANAEKYSLDTFGHSQPWIEDQKAGKLWVSTKKPKTKPGILQAPAEEPVLLGDLADLGELEEPKPGLSISDQANLDGWTPAISQAPKAIAWTAPIYGATSQDLQAFPHELTQAKRIYARSYFQTNPADLDLLDPAHREAWLNDNPTTKDKYNQYLASKGISSPGTPATQAPPKWKPGDPLDHKLLQQIDLHDVEPTWQTSNPDSVRYGGVLFDNSGKVLLRMPKRKPDGSWYDGYAWTFPKGGKEYGSTAIDTAVKEVGEETGHQAQAIGIVPGLHSSGNSTNAYFIMKSTNYDPNLMDKETEETRWVDYDEARKLIQLGTNAGGVKRDLGVLEAAFKENAKIVAGKADYTHIFKGAEPPPPPVKKPPKPPARIVPPVDLYAQKPAFPEALHQVKDLGGAGGTTGARLVQDPASGKKFIRKVNTKNPDQARIEAAANHMYAAAGIRTPETQLYKGTGGQPDVMLTEYVESVKLSEYLAKATKAQEKKIKEQLQAGFATDALLMNWDVLGADGDNVRVDKDGNAWRVDNGGSFDISAMGGTKPEPQTEYPMALWSMRGKAFTEYGDPAEKHGGAADWSRRIYGDMTMSQLGKSCRETAARRPEILAATPPEHRELIARKLDHLEHLGNVQEQAQKTGLSDSYQDEFLRILISHHQAGISDAVPKELKAQRVGKVNKQTRTDYSTSLEDENGLPFDKLRTHSGAKKELSLTARIKQAIADKGGDYMIIQEWAGEQAGSSWRSLPQAVKYWFSQQNGSTNRCYWRGGLADAKQEYEQAKAQWDQDDGKGHVKYPGRFERTLKMYHAATVDFLNRTELPNKNPDGTITLVRTDGDSVMSHFGNPAVGTHVKGAKRGALESTSLLNPISSPSGTRVCRQKVPLTNVFGAYLLERTPGRGDCLFMGDHENEFVVHLADMEFDYVASSPSSYLD